MNVKIKKTELERCLKHHAAKFELKVEGASTNALATTGGKSLPAGVTHVPSTEPEGDNNAFVYVTRKVNLKTPATTLKVIADNFRPPNTDLKFMFKIIKADANPPVDDIGFEFFNTDGSPDKSIEVDQRNFK